jgi:6-phosphogluconolactonase/glucosamine-6-phosphate isomerase/deaminase
MAMILSNHARDKDRITMTPRLLTAASYVCLLFFGESRREALARFSAESSTATACPARLLLCTPHLLVVADAGAVGEYSQTRIYLPDFREKE